MLDSYSLERQAIFRDVGEDIIGGWIADDRTFLARYHPDADPDEFAERCEEVTRGFGKRLQGFERHHEGSLLVIGPPGGTSSAHGRHTFRAQADHHLPPRPLSSGGNVFERLGEGFTLLALDADDAAVGAFQRATVATRVPLTVVRDTLADGREAYACRLVLVRPDQVRGLDR